MYTKEFIHTQNKKIQAHTPIFNLNEEILMTLERIEQSRLTDLTIKALQTYGLSEPDARSTAEILVLAAMFGLHTHGVSRVESYGERLELGGIKASAQKIGRANG